MSSKNEPASHLYAWPGAHARPITRSCSSCHAQSSGPCSEHCSPRVATRRGPPPTPSRPRPPRTPTPATPCSPRTPICSSASPARAPPTASAPPSTPTIVEEILNLHLLLDGSTDREAARAKYLPAVPR